jgi:exosortase A-associated hydrolase 1
MSRRHLEFGCEGETLVGTLDDASGTTGLLIVSGGNEIRAGAFAGQAELAMRIAAAGHPVFRFDRRGIGDSSGENRGFRENALAIAAALRAFRSAKPDIRRIVAFGNCDAASALMLASSAGWDGLVLANPWTFEANGGDALPPAAIRARYARKLRNPREWLRLASAKVDLGKLAKGLRGAASSPAPPTTLAQALADGLEGFDGPVSILIAERDRTGQAFMAGWKARDARVRTCPGASHAFVEAHAREWLLGQLLSALTNE